MTVKGLKYLRWGTIAYLLLLVWPVYRYMLLYTAKMFNDPLEDMSHGWVVPVVSAFTIWWRRRQIKASAGLPSWKGLLWVCFFMTIGWFGGRGAQSRIEQVALIGLIWAVPYALWGSGVARLLVFPASFLVFTIPISSFADFFTIHLRIFASSLATAILNGFGLAVQQSGTALLSKVPGAEFNVDVADPCSGIRSLFALMALTAAYAFYTQKHIAQKWLLFACAIPLAVVGNACRIFSICLVATWFGQEAATGFYHDFSGYVVFLVAVLLMVESGRLIGRLDAFFQTRLRFDFLENVWRKRESDGRCPTATHVVPIGGVLLLATALYVAKLVLPPPVFEKADFVAAELPANVGDFVGDTPWFCHNDQCLEVVEERQVKAVGTAGAAGFLCPRCGRKLYAISLGEQTELPGDTVVMKRDYQSADGLVYRVSVVVGGRTRGSIHRAELCLPAQGFVMLSAKRRALHVSTGAPRRVRLIEAMKNGASPLTLLYWFASRERENCSHVARIWIDIWDRSIHNRINRWVMVSVNSSSPLETPESVERLETFLAEFYPKVIRKL